LYGSTVIHYCDRPNPSYLKVICTGKDGMTTAKGFPHPFKYFLFSQKVRFVGNEGDLNTLSPVGRFLSWCRLSQLKIIARLSAA
jgi:hypothetical protein